MLLFLCILASHTVTSTSPQPSAEPLHFLSFTFLKQESETSFLGPQHMERKLGCPCGSFMPLTVICGEGKHLPGART